MLYFFDSNDGATYFRDDTGVELPGIDAARDMASRGLADLAKEAIPGATRRELSIDVRDGDGLHLFRVSLSSAPSSRAAALKRSYWVAES